MLKGDRRARQVEARASGSPGACLGCAGRAPRRAGRAPEDGPGGSGCRGALSAFFGLPYPCDAGLPLPHARLFACALPGRRQNCAAWIVALVPSAVLSPQAATALPLALPAMSGKGRTGVGWESGVAGPPARAAENWAPSTTPVPPRLRCQVASAAPLLASATRGCMSTPTPGPDRVRAGDRTPEAEIVAPKAKSGTDASSGLVNQASAAPPDALTATCPSRGRSSPLATCSTGPSVPSRAIVRVRRLMMSVVPNCDQATRAVPFAAMPTSRSALVTPVGVRSVTPGSGSPDGDRRWAWRMPCWFQTASVRSSWSTTSSTSSATPSVGVSVCTGPGAPSAGSWRTLSAAPKPISSIHATVAAPDLCITTAVRSVLSVGSETGMTGPAAPLASTRRARSMIGPDAAPHVPSGPWCQVTIPSPLRPTAVSTRLRLPWPSLSWNRGSSSPLRPIRRASIIVLSFAAASSLRCHATRNEPSFEAATDGKPVWHGAPSGVPGGDRSTAACQSARAGTVAIASATSAIVTTQSLRPEPPTARESTPAAPLLATARPPGDIGDDARRPQGRRVPRREGGARRRAGVRQRDVDRLRRRVRSSPSHPVYLISLRLTQQRVRAVSACLLCRLPGPPAAMPLGAG